MSEFKTRYKFIHIERIGIKHRRDSWAVINNRHGSGLGRIEWYPAWRRWIFAPISNTIYSTDCLADIIDFIKQLNRPEEKHVG